VSPHHTTTYYYYPRHTSDAYLDHNYCYITPARTPPLRPAIRIRHPDTTPPTDKMPGVLRVTISPNPTSSCRPLRYDERSVLEAFNNHASHCSDCADPLATYHAGGTLCSRGHAYARDLGQYVYFKAGRAWSLLDREDTGERVQIEVPAPWKSVRALCEAASKGLRIKSRREAERVVVQHQSRRDESPAREREWDRRNGYEVIENGPRHRRRRDEGRGREKKRDTVYVKGRGSLYWKDEEERRQREEPRIVVVEPRRR